MDQKQIDFIRSRWAGRACGSDIQKLVDEITTLEEIIETQTYTIEDTILDKIGKPPDWSERVADLKHDLENSQAHNDSLLEEIEDLNEKLSQMEQ